jgi:hypothetical protein
MNSVADALARAIWLSHLDPLGSISININRGNSSVPVHQRLYQDEIDTRKLRAKYGPRPDGLPG